ncbi:hypothetical protein V8E54_009021 [Elaphomyces granulatus]
MHDKYIQYDVDTRWNSTYHMIQDGLNAEKQIANSSNSKRSFLPSPEKISRLKKLKIVLSKFDEFTSEISKNAPQISMALPIYYDLHELLLDEMWTIFRVRSRPCRSGKTRPEKVSKILHFHG